MINIDKDLLISRIIGEYTKYSEVTGVLPISSDMVTEFKLGKKFVYRLNETHNKQLSNIHDKLVSDFLNKIPLNKAVTAYTSGKSYLDFLEPHRNNYHFVRIDLRNFFHSISRNLISKSLEPYFDVDFTDKDKKQNLLNAFINLVTYKVPDSSKNSKFSKVNILPMGFKTSPSISNIVFRKIDILIEHFCSQNNIIYTRYADDMLFSSKTNSEPYENYFDELFNPKSKRKSFLHSERFIDEISFLVNIEKFKLNTKKTIKSVHTISLNGYTIEGSNYSDIQGTIRISNKKTHIISKLIHEIQKEKTARSIMTKLFDFKVSKKHFNHFPVKNEHIERYCRDQILNKITGYRSYLISLLKYNEKYNCIDNNSILKYEKYVSDLEELI